MRSLSSRLVLGTILVVATILIFIAVMVFMNVEAVLYNKFDQVLLGKSRTLSALTTLQRDGIELDFADTDFEEFSRRENPEYFQLWLHDGSTLERSESLPDGDLDKDEVEFEQPSFRSVVLPDRRMGRQATLVFFPKIADELRSPLPEDDFGDPHDELNERVDEAVTVVVAASTSEVDDFLAGLRKLLFGVSCAGLLLASGLAFAVVKRSLAPLHRVAAKIEQFDEYSLDQRIDIGDAPEELVPVVTRVNSLLGRLDTVFRRERAFSSEVAHELRTPLSGLLSTIEVCLRQPRDVENYKDSLRNCRTICQQCETMVEGLLEIAQLERGDVPLTMDVVDFNALLTECWEPFKASAAEKQLSVNWPDVVSMAPLEFESDTEKLRVIIRNLLQNAVSHSNEGGWITISVTSDEKDVWLSVENTGNTVASENAGGVFDRFWRGDDARSRTGEHFGLGLSLVKKLVEVLNGTATVHVGSTFRADLTFPLTTSDG